MRGLNFPFNPATPPKILCLGAHSDDIEIGCGGAILRLAQQYPGASFTWVVFTGSGARASEARNAAKLFAGEAITAGPQLKGFQDGFLPFVGGEVKTEFEKLKQLPAPDLIFTHSRLDSHQDHRLLGELTWNTFRDHLILEYEIPKYDGDLGQPSVFIPLDAAICEKKIEFITEAFVSQKGKAWFKPELFRSLMRIRGMECNAPSGYAEAFFCRKLAL